MSLAPLSATLELAPAVAVFQSPVRVSVRSPAAIDFHSRLTYPSAGQLRTSAIAEIAEAFKPQYLVVLQDWDDKFGIVDGLRANGFMVREIYAGRARPGTPDAHIYHLFELTLPATDRSDRIPNRSG